MLAEPITIIFNASLASGVVASSWKESNIVPIPKTSKPIAEADTRPISRTSCLSKVLEDFVVSWLIEDVKEKIDPSQFGCLKGISTTFCLSGMLHTWLSHLDGLGNHLRICFLDFSQAFERIGYNLLKTLSRNVPCARVVCDPELKIKISSLQVEIFRENTTIRSAALSLST